MIKVFWGLVALIILGGTLWFSAGKNEAVLTQRTSLAPMPSSDALAASLWSELAAPLEQTSVIFWGSHTNDEYVTEVLRAFIAHRPVGQKAFDEIWVDEEFQNIFQDRSLYRPIFLRGNGESLKAEVTAIIKSGKRILILTAPVAASTFVVDSPAYSLRDLGVVSLLFTEFPRRRVDEVDQRIPCVLSHVDQTGTGAIGCLIVQAARAEYGKSFAPQTRVGLLSELNSQDYLYLMAIEPKR